MNDLAALLGAPNSRGGALARRLLAAAAVSTGVLAATSAAHAGALNDPGCKPTAARPYPAIVVHGQAGNYQGMAGVTGALAGAGYCVYAMNYGHVPGGANGQDHLSTSAGQISAQIDKVLAQTGAAKGDVIGHSAGTGVLDNYILKKGGAAKVHRMVSFGGLHHPYAHAGAARFLDASLFLPNLTKAARAVVPGFSVQQVVKVALDVYGAAGAPLGMVDPALRATAESNFTSDLFDPDYWEDLHGGLSEAPMSFVKVGKSERSLTTKDAAPNVCYTNIVAVADLLAGAAAGFQDEASNVDNFTLVTSVTTNAHNDMLGDAVALGKMLAGLSSPCTPAAPKATVGGPTGGGDETDPASRDASDAFESAVEGSSGSQRKGVSQLEPPPDVGGCSVAYGTTSTAAPAASVGLLAAALGFVTWARRRCRAPR